MSKISIKEMRDMLIPDVRDQRNRLKKINLSHIIINSDLNKVNQNIFGAYQDTIEELCGILDIHYEQVHVDRKLGSIRSTINKLNSNPSVHGILYDNPFEVKSYTDQIGIGITSVKDIECLNPVTVGKFICNENSVKIPCFIASLTELLFMHNLGKVNRRILSINGSHGTKNKFISKNSSSDMFTMTTTSPSDTDFISTNFYNYDIIISMLFDTDYYIDENIIDMMSSPKIVLDYGYCSKMSRSSIDPELFYMNTAYYNIFDGLIDLYVINALHNLCKSYK